MNNEILNKYFKKESISDIKLLLNEGFFDSITKIFSKKNNNKNNFNDQILKKIKSLFSLGLNTTYEIKDNMNDEEKTDFINEFLARHIFYLISSTSIESFEDFYRHRIISRRYRSNKDNNYATMNAKEKEKYKQGLTFANTDISGETLAKKFLENSYINPYLNYSKDSFNTNSDYLDAIIGDLINYVTPKGLESETFSVNLFGSSWVKKIQKYKYKNIILKHRDSKEEIEALLMQKMEKASKDAGDYNTLKNKINFKTNSEISKEETEKQNIAIKREKEREKINLFTFKEIIFNYEKILEKLPVPLKLPLSTQVKLSQSMINKVKKILEAIIILSGEKIVIQGPAIINQLIDLINKELTMTIRTNYSQLQNEDSIDKKIIKKLMNITSIIELVKILNFDNKEGILLATNLNNVTFDLLKVSDSDYYTLFNENAEIEERINSFIKQIDNLKK